MNFTPPINITAKCPHGSTPGGCPICNGGGGSGGGSVRKNQMSWDECYREGQAIRAAKQRAEMNNLYFQQSINNAIQQKNTEQAYNFKMIQQISNAVNRTVMPAMNVINNIKTPVVKLFSSITATASDIAKTIRENIKNFTEKFSENMQKVLSAVLNQTEALKKSVSEAFSKIKKKFIDMVTETDGKMNKNGGKKKDNQQQHQKDEKNAD